MISKTTIEEILKEYNVSSPNELTIGVLGGHSALDVCSGAKKYGFKTLAVCQKGREKTYSEYYKTRVVGDREIGCVDDVILVEKFGDIVNEEVQEELRKRKTIFIHNRYFWVYCDFEKIERDFEVPIYGSRELVKLEERDHPNNQYVLLEKAGIRIPKIVREGGKAINESELRGILDNHFISNGGPLIVKVNEAERSYERAFFVILSTDDYFNIGEEKVKKGEILQKDLDNAVIEEFIMGAQINFNYFYSPITGQLELMGTDTRRQTSLDGFLRLDAVTQTQMIDLGYKPSMIETGHIACTVKESLVEKALEAGEKFIRVLEKEVADGNISAGMIGPFALQGAIQPSQGKEEFVVFDVSMRIPGSPGTKFTPYSGYLFGESVSYGERIGIELEMAVKEGRLKELLT